MKRIIEKIRNIFKIKITWEGTLTYPKEQNASIRIRNMKFSENGDITGNGSLSLFKKFFIRGRINTEGMVTFTTEFSSKNIINSKKFQGFYNGFDSIIGSWISQKNPNNKGTFKLIFSKGRQFKGNYIREDIKSPLPVECFIQVERKEIWGLGKDEIGVFVISGRRINSKREFEFSRNYIGGFELHHKCKMRVNHDKTLQFVGEWINSGIKSRGKFELHEVKFNQKKYKKEKKEKSDLNFKDKKGGNNVIERTQLLGSMFQNDENYGFKMGNKGKNFNSSDNRFSENLKGKTLYESYFVTTDFEGKDFKGGRGKSLTGVKEEDGDDDFDEEIKKVAVVF